MLRHIHENGDVALLGIIRLKRRAGRVDIGDRPVETEIRGQNGLDFLRLQKRVALDDKFKQIKGLDIASRIRGLFLALGGRGFILRPGRLRQRLGMGGLDVRAQRERHRQA